jgi:hypothetical protein
MDVRETDCEDARWMELAQESAQWCWVLVVLNLRVLLAERYIVHIIAVKDYNIIISNQSISQTTYTSI